MREKKKTKNEKKVIHEKNVVIDEKLLG